MKEVNAKSCTREHELVGFIYGELNEVEARGFQRHLNECASCNTEIASLRDVRQAVVGWRNESLGAIGVATKESTAPAIQRKPSALAAIQAFLKLSPLWLKGAVAFATLVICALAAIGVARLRNNQPQVIVAAPAQPAQRSQDESKEIDAIVKQRVSEQLAQIKQSENLTSNNTNERFPARVQRVSARTPVYSARRPLSKTERQQLAADLRLLSSNNENDVDLLEDRINQ